MMRAARCGGAPAARRAPARTTTRCAGSARDDVATRLAAAAAAACVSLSALLGGGASSSSWPGAAAPAPAATATAAAAPGGSGLRAELQLYEQQVARLHQQQAAAAARLPPPLSLLPSVDEGRALLTLVDRDLFTSDGLAGMVRLQQYAQYVEQTAAPLEAAPGCEACAANRVTLEKAWQTVASEFYDASASGRFSQAAWAGQLLETLRSHGGALRSRADTYAALHQLVASLGDRYSEFLEPSAFRRALRRPLPAERNYLAAQFVGVGLQFGQLSKDLGGRLVEAPLAESPAEGAGIRKGDRVLEIDGLPAELLTLDETITLLRGPAGSSVSLLVAPAGPVPQPPRRLELERRSLPQPALREAQLPLPDGRFVQYVRLHYFAHETTTGLAAVVAAAESDDRQRVAGYILDLRNDPGGVFDEAVAIASLFEDPSAAVAETVRSGSSRVDVVWRPSGLSPALWPDVAAGPLTSKPLVLLVNGNTASASEVLAGALHDHGRAVLLGERTFGKGVVQGYFPLPQGDGSGLKLTVAKYLTPRTHYDISRDGGLTPDQTCRDFPHGVFTPGTADHCVLAAITTILSAPQPDPLSFSPLLADAADAPR